MLMSAGVLDLRSSTRTLIMGVINATPDSFFQPSCAGSVEEAVALARAALEAGADIIDVGGESSRPGAAPAGQHEELRRAVPIVDALRETNAFVSIDTFRAETARQAIESGARMVNDITALRADPDMARVVAESGVQCVLMHMQGMPQTMQEDPRYDDVVDDVKAFFEQRIRFADAQGIAQDQLWLDPGFGFGKTVQHNLTILRRLQEFSSFGLPVLIGTSNKSTIGTVLGADVDERAEGTAATVALAIRHGAKCVRVHDVKAMARVAKMTDAVLGKTDFE